MLPSYESDHRHGLHNGSPLPEACLLCRSAYRVLVYGDPAVTGHRHERSLEAFSLTTARRFATEEIAEGATRVEIADHTGAIVDEVLPYDREPTDREVIA